MDEIKILQFKLYQLGYIRSSDISGDEDAITISAVRKFQTDFKLTVNGSFDQKTKDKLIELTSKYNPEYDSGNSSVYTGDEAEASKEEEEAEVSSPFFNKDMILRKSNVPIRIEYGPNRKMKKTITNVFFRSLGQEVDGSGNPIYEVIEFIGKDIEEE